MPRENASLATRSRCQCVEVDCLLVLCGVEQDSCCRAAGGTESRARSSGRAQGSRPEIAAVAPGAGRHLTKEVRSWRRKYHAVTRRREELASWLLQSAT